MATLAATLTPDPSRGRAAHLCQAGLQPPELAREVLVQFGLLRTPPRLLRQLLLQLRSVPGARAERRLSSHHLNALSGAWAARVSDTRSLHQLHAAAGT